jgi:hypothetical protein
MCLPYVGRVSLTMGPKWAIVDRSGALARAVLNNGSLRLGDNNSSRTFLTKRCHRSYILDSWLTARPGTIVAWIEKD